MYKRFAGTRTIAVSAEIIKALLSTVTFVILAVRFGPSDYGIYVQYAAVAAILVPIATLAFSQWVQPMTISSGTSVAVSAAISVLICVSLPVGILTMLTFSAVGQGGLVLYLVIAAEMVIYPLWASVCLCLLGEGKPMKYLALSAMVVATKLFGSAVAVFFMDGGLLTWGIVVNLFGWIGFLSTALLLGFRGIRPGMKELRLWRNRGVSYSLVGLASSLTDNVDKVILGQTLGSSTTGTYGAGSKVASYGAVPVKGLAIAAYPRYFSLVEDKQYDEVRTQMRSNIRRGFLLGLIVALVALVAVYFASITLLSSYEGLFACSALLALVIPIRSVQYGAGDVLYAVGKSHLRLLFTVLGAVLSGLSVFALAGYMGLMGAAAAIVISSAVIAAGLLWLAEHSISVAVSQSRVRA